MSFLFATVWVEKLFVDDASTSYVLQTIGMGASVVAAALYLMRWHNLSSNILREYEVIDYSKKSFPLNELQQVASVGRNHEISAIQNIISTKSALGLCLWGSNRVSNEAVILECLKHSKARLLWLDFGKAVWKGSFDGWLERMEYTSSPLRALLKQFISLIKGINGNASEEDTNTDTAMESKFVRFRTFLSEKAQVMKRMASKDKNRPLFIVVSGLDHMSMMEDTLGPIGFKLVSEYVNHIANIGNYSNQIRSILLINDKFWWRYWINNNIVNLKFVTFHIGEANSKDVFEAWKQRLSDEHLPVSNKLNDESLSFIIDNWGTCALELSRVIAIAKLSSSFFTVERLIQDDVRRVAMTWISDRYQLIQQTRKEMKSIMDEQSSNLLENNDEIEEYRKKKWRRELKVMKMLSDSPSGSVSLIELLQATDHEEATSNSLLTTAILLVERDLLRLTVLSSSSNVLPCAGVAEIDSNLSNICEGLTSQMTQRISNALTVCTSHYLDKLVVTTNRKIELHAIRYICSLCDDT